MSRIIKCAAAAVLTGAMALAVATPSQARWRGHWHGGAAAAAGGFIAGAAIGAAAASADGYYYGPGYYDGPGYAYDAPAYGYEPVYSAPAYSPGGCWVATDKDRGYGYYGACP